MNDYRGSEERRITRLAFVSLPRSLHGEIERLAVRDGRSADEVISLIVEGYLELPLPHRSELAMDDIPF